jgi:hypothetical protein
MESYNLDREAQQLVLGTIQELKGKDSKYINQVIGQVFDMRTTVTYGLERFWGEHLRFFQKDKQKDRDQLEKNKGEYWKKTWNKFREVMKEAGIDDLPEAISYSQVNQIQAVDIQKKIDALWQRDPEDRQILLAVLIQFCDAMIWWTQRLKPRNKD